MGARWRARVLWPGSSFSSQNKNPTHKRASAVPASPARRFSKFRDEKTSSNAIQSFFRAFVHFMDTLDGVCYYGIHIFLQLEKLCPLYPYKILSIST